jgi:alginate O-acetyltransferase complex protein AlgJ
MGRAENRLTREEEAKQDIGHTDISPKLAKTVTAVFVALLLAMPLVQHGLGLVEVLRGSEPEYLGFYREFNGLGAELTQARRQTSGFFKTVFSSNALLLKRMVMFQDALDEQSFLARLTRRPVQEILCRMGAGNEKGIVGRGGWLFYEPDVAYVTGPGFLEPRRLRQRALSGNESVKPPQPDPVLGIVHFRDQLAQRGVQLIVMPTPLKPTVHPEKLGRRSLKAGLRNASYNECIRRLRNENVLVFDCLEKLLEYRRQSGQAAYLETDTHWTPQAMTAVAEALADELDESVTAPDKNPFMAEAVAQDNLGDIAVMLQLPEDQQLYLPETVQLTRVLRTDSTPWAADPEADVLLLGDSFCNIYSLEAMNWGTSAGLAEHLSFALKRPVDRIVRNDAGSWATRDMLATEMARGNDRLAGKKIVIWQFAERELAGGDWKLIELPEVPADTTERTRLPGSVLVTCTVAEVSSRPDRNAVYADFVMKLYVTGMVDEAGKLPGDGDGVVHVMAMRQRKILPIASTQEGAAIALRLVEWDQVSDQYGSLRVGDLNDPTLEITKNLYWGEEP